MFGIHTALVTPFTADDGLDLHAFERICQEQVAAGVHGLVVGGTTGESPTLSSDELAALTRVARATAGRQVPVSVGVGTNDTRSSVQKAEGALAWGASTGLLVLPYYNKPNAEGHRRHVAAVARVGLPLVIYHVPGRTGQRLDVGLLAELADVPGVVAVKEATGDVRYGTDLIRRTRTPVLSGDDFSFLGLLAQGGTGCVSVVSNVAPAATVAVYAHQVAGRPAEAASALASIWPLVTWLFADASPVPCKAAMEALGLCGRHVRLPLAPWTGAVPDGLLDVARR